MWDYVVWYKGRPSAKNIYRILDISDQQNNPVSVESEALPEIELHHQEDINNCDVGNSDSDSSSSSASAKKRARIDEQSAALSSINPLKLIRRLVPGTNQETYTIQDKEKQHILQRLEEENCQTPKKQETQQDNTVSHFVDKYMVFCYQNCSALLWEKLF